MPTSEPHHSDSEHGEDTTERSNQDRNEHEESKDSNTCFDEIPEDNPKDDLEPWVDYTKREQYTKRTTYWNLTMDSQTEKERHEEDTSDIMWLTTQDNNSKWGCFGKRHHKHADSDSQHDSRPPVATSATTQPTTASNARDWSPTTTVLHFLSQIIDSWTSTAPKQRWKPNRRHTSPKRRRRNRRRRYAAHPLSINRDPPLHQRNHINRTRSNSRNQFFPKTHPYQVQRISSLKQMQDHFEEIWAELHVELSRRGSGPRTLTSGRWFECTGCHRQYWMKHVEYVTTNRDVTCIICVSKLNLFDCYLFLVMFCSLIQWNCFSYLPLFVFFESRCTVV